MGAYAQGAVGVGAEVYPVVGAGVFEEEVSRQPEVGRLGDAVATEPVGHGAELVGGIPVGDGGGHGCREPARTYAEGVHAVAHGAGIVYVDVVHAVPLLQHAYLRYELPDGASRQLRHRGPVARAPRAAAEAYGEDVVLVVGVAVITPQEQQEAGAGGVAADRKSVV